MRRRQSNSNNSNSNPKRRCCCCSSSPSPSMMMLLILFMTILVVLFPGSSSSSVMGFIVPTKFSSSRTTVASTVSTTTTIPSIAIANSAPKTTRTSLKKSTMIFSSSIDSDSDDTNNAAGAAATATDETNTNTDTASSTGISKKRKPTGFSFWYKIPKKAYRLYTGYAKQLWKDTDTSARSKIANDKVAQTVRDMQHVLSNEYATNIDDQQADDEDTISSSSSSSSSSSDGSKKSEEAKERLLQACDDMLIILDENNNDKSESTAVVAVATEDPDADTAKQLAAVPTKKKVAKKQRSVLFGAVMGALVAGWVFSGNYIFTGLFCLITILGQLEYYRMIMNTGVFPARRISVVGATSMFVTVRIYIYIIS